jgi:hypothetical protein
VCTLQFKCSHAGTLDTRHWLHMGAIFMEQGICAIDMHPIRVIEFSSDILGGFALRL